MSLGSLLLVIQLPISQTSNWAKRKTVASYINTNLKLVSGELERLGYVYKNNQNE